MAKKDKKAEAKVTKLEVNPKEENATPETNEVPVADPLKEIVESSIPENFVGGHSNEIDPTTITPIPAFSDEQVTATTSELKDPEFHEKEESAESVVEVNDMQGKPRYHRQDVVHIAQVAFEAFKTYRMVNGYLPVKHWDDESDELKQTFINQIEKALYADLITPAELNKEDLLILAIVNALK